MDEIFAVSIGTVDTLVRKLDGNNSGGSGSSPFSRSKAREKQSLLSEEMLNNVKTKEFSFIRIVMLVSLLIMHSCLPKFHFICLDRKGNPIEARVHWEGQPIDSRGHFDREKQHQSGLLHGPPKREKQSVFREHRQ